ncbi:hypothetical protein ERJ75_000629000 [Trypanosoma vivax]|nr:hypothetical protein ERJ75_000629000 [Trypanosoma vivax]
METALCLASPLLGRCVVVPARSAADKRSTPTRQRRVWSLLATPAARRGASNGGVGSPIRRVSARRGSSCSVLDDALTMGRRAQHREVPAHLACFGLWRRRCARFFRRQLRVRRYEIGPTRALNQASDRLAWRPAGRKQHLARATVRTWHDRSCNSLAASHPGDQQRPPAACDDGRSTPADVRLTDARLAG